MKWIQSTTKRKPKINDQEPSVNERETKKNKQSKGKKVSTKLPFAFAWYNNGNDQKNMRCEKNVCTMIESDIVMRYFRKRKQGKPNNKQPKPYSRYDFVVEFKCDNVMPIIIIN